MLQLLQHAAAAVAAASAAAADVVAAAAAAAKAGTAAAAAVVTTDFADSIYHASFCFVCSFQAMSLILVLVCFILVLKFRNQARIYHCNVYPLHNRRNYLTH